MPTLEIGQIAIPTHDLPRAVAFYRDALGLEYLFEAGPLAFFMCGDVRIMLAVPETRRSTIRARSSTSAWPTSTPRDELARGVPFDDEPHLIARMPDHELWMTFFRDPDRNLLGLMAEACQHRDDLVRRSASRPQPSVQLENRGRGGTRGPTLESVGSA